MSIQRGPNPLDKSRTVFCREHKGAVIEFDPVFTGHLRDCPLCEALEKVADSAEKTDIDELEGALCDIESAAISLRSIITDIQRRNKK